MTYPAAVTYLSGQEDGHNQVDGAAPATITVDACTNDSESSLVKYYDDTLTRNGWVRRPDQPPSTGAFTRTVSWGQGNAYFDLSIDTQATADALASHTGKPAGCPTGYQTLVQLNR